MTIYGSLSYIPYLSFYASLALLFMMVFGFNPLSYAMDMPTSLFFGNEINISSNNGTSDLPQIATQGSNVYVVWQDDTSGNKEVYYSRSIDHGKNFGIIRNLSNNTGSSEVPQIATQGSNVYVAWQDDTSGNKEVYFKRSPNNGISFKGKKVDISNNNGSSELPQIATQGSNVYVAWQDNTSGDYDAYFKHIYDYGRKFVKGTSNISRNAGQSIHPDIGAFDKNVYVIWKEIERGKDRIFFKSGAVGETPLKIKFSSTYKIPYGGDVSGPIVAIGPNFFYSLWVTNKKDTSSVIDFYPIKLFEDTSPEPISLTRPSSNGNITNVSIATSGNDAYIGWVNMNSGNGDIYLKRLSIDSFDRSKSS